MQQGILWCSSGTSERLSIFLWVYLNSSNRSNFLFSQFQAFFSTDSPKSALILFTVLFLPLFCWLCLAFFFLPTCLSVSAEIPFTAMFVKNTFVHLCVNAYTHSHTLFCIQINPIHLSHFPHLGRSHGTLQFSGCPTLGGLVLVWQICCYFSHCWTTGSLQIVSWNRLDGR